MHTQSTPLQRGLVLFAASLLLAATTTASSIADSQVGAASPNADGERLLQTGAYAQAEVSFQTALNNAPKKTPAELYAMLGLGEAMLWQGKIKDAEKILKKANSLQDKVGADATLQSRALDDMAWVYQAQRDLPKAMEQAIAALKIRQSQGPGETFNTIISLIHIAYLADLQGQLSQAADYYKQALALMPPGYADLLAADTQQRLAAILWRLGNTADAQKLYDQGLNTELQTQAPLQKYAPHPYWQDVVHRFQSGAPNTSLRSISGQQQEIIWANGVTVAATAPVKVPASKSLQVQIAIKNDSQQPVQFLPQPPVLVSLAPRVEIAKLLDPQTIAQSIENKGEKKAKWIRFWGADATQSVTSTYINSGPNYYGWGYNNIPPIMSYGGAMPVINRSGNMTTVITQVPDYAAQQRALEKAANAIADSKATAEDIRASSIGPTTVQPGNVVKGALYFDLDDASQSVVQLPVGNATFEFDFPPK